VGKTLTWTHVIDATSAKFITEFVTCSKAEVGYCDPKAVVEAENVLWLQVSVVNTERVAVFHCVEQLEEDVLDESIVSEITATMQDLGEEIVVRCIVHDDVGMISLINDAMEGDHARVGRGELVECYFADVDLSLARGLVARGDEALDSVGLLTGGVASVDSTIYDAVSTNTQNFDKFQGTSVNESSEGWVDGGAGLRRGLRRHWSGLTA